MTPSQTWYGVVNWYEIDGKEVDYIKLLDSEDEAVTVAKQSRGTTYLVKVEVVNKFVRNTWAY